MCKKILVKIGEIFTKKQNRKDFLKVLIHNIQKSLKTNPQLFYDRILIDYSEENLEKLKYVFGIQNYMVVFKCKSETKEIEKTIDFLISKVEKIDTFKIITKRSWKQFSLTTNESNIHFGSFVVKKTNWKVSLKNSQLNIYIEITDKFTAIYSEIFHGLGGYPVGINGKVLHLLSGGLDSPVSAFEMMKRGIEVSFLNFITPPHTDQKTVEKVQSIIKVLNNYQNESVLYTYKYTDLLNLISLTSENKYRIILMRRSFYRIANQITKKSNFLGISNGENLGQVASQTLESLKTIQEVSKLPIYRPVLTSNKMDIIEKSKKLGLYDISITKSKETCELFAPKFPVIRPKISKAKELEIELPNLFEMEKDGIKKHLTKKII